MNKVNLYLIRHGKTEGNEKCLYCGYTDLPLSDKGKTELESLKGIYKVCDSYYTTGLKRTNETLNILFDCDNYSIEEGFKEYNFGDFEMKGYEELKNKKEYIDWIEDVTGKYVIPNGECKNSYRERIKDTFYKFINKIFSKNQKNVALICHGGTIGTILEQFYNNEKNLFDWQPSCGRGYLLEITLENNKINIVNMEKI